MKLFAASARKWAVAGALLMLGAGAASAQSSVENFYRGKTITLYIGTGESAGAVGAYPRSIAQVIKKHIPGNPADAPLAAARGEIGRAHV